MKVLVAEKIAQEGIDYITSQGIAVDVKLGIGPDEVAQIIGEYDGLVVRSATKVNANLLAHATQLKVVGRAGVGVDNIDVDACTKRGIVVVNTPDGNTMAAAEMAIALAFSIFRNVPQAYAAAIHQNDFRRAKFVGNEMDAKVAGVIGLGKIGGIVASKLRGLNMKVIAYDPFVADEKFHAMGIERCNTLAELLPKADLITIHMPKTKETYGMIGEKEIALCKDGVRIVNAARGGLVDEKALYEGLFSGKVAAAGIDILDPEPNYTKTPEEQDYKNPLLTHPNCVAVPHLGASTTEANYNVGVHVAHYVADSLKGSMVAAVNMPSMHVDNLADLKPYLDLGEVLGGIYYQTESDTVQRIEIVYTGDARNMETRVITLSVIKGFLSTFLEDTQINFVNARLCLEQTGINLTESQQTSHEKYTNLVTVRFITAHKTLSVSGSVFSNKEIRLVDFFGYRLSFQPENYVLAIQNHDRPGMIGQIGTLLGANNVNVAAMQLGRNRRGDKAVSFVSVDNTVPDDVLKQLRTIEGIIRASFITFNIQTEEGI